VIFQKLEELQVDTLVYPQDNVVIQKQKADKMFPRLVSLEVHNLGCVFFPSILRRLIIRKPFAVSRIGAEDIELLAGLLVDRCCSLCELQLGIADDRHSEGVGYTSEFASSPGWPLLKYISCINIVCLDLPSFERMFFTGGLAFHLANRLGKNFQIPWRLSEPIIIFTDQLSV
jgi:hypothetical protein